MNLLILGGTLFVGRQLVKAALADGHSVTIFHRGKLNTEPVEGVHQIIGDREADLDKLGTTQWDVVFDTCCYIPRVLRSSLKALKHKTDLYVLISTVSVYNTEGSQTLNEDSEKLPLIDENPEDQNIETKGYGSNKLACEILLRETMPNSHLILRPGVITGPYDITRRITYWLERFQHGGKVVSIRNPNTPVQWIDVRDLCEWAVRMAKNRMGGTYNTVGPDQPFTSGDLYRVCEEIIGVDVEMVYLPMDFVMTLSKWHFPPGGLGLCFPNWESFHKVSNQKALNQGFTLRDPKTTFLDTYEWSKQWNHDYYHQVAGRHASHGNMEEQKAMEKEILNSYEEWLKKDPENRKG